MKTRNWASNRLGESYEEVITDMSNSRGDDGATCGLRTTGSRLRRAGLRVGILAVLGGPTLIHMDTTVTVQQLAQ